MSTAGEECLYGNPQLQPMSGMEREAAGKEDVDAKARRDDGFVLQRHGVLAGKERHRAAGARPRSDGTVAGLVPEQIPGVVLRHRGRLSI